MQWTLVGRVGHSHGAISTVVNWEGEIRIVCELTGGVSGMKLNVLKYSPPPPALKPEYNTMNYTVNNDSFYTAEVRGQ